MDETNPSKAGRRKPTLTESSEKQLGGRTTERAHKTTHMDFHLLISCDN